MRTREKVRFTSGDAECAAWWYPGSGSGCVVMAGGAGVPKEPGTDAFAARFQAAGFQVLAFDYRGWGESGGRPRQVIRIGDQLEDWRAALAYCRARPDVDETRVALWGFSLSGGHVFLVAAQDPWVAAVIAQAPLVDGRAAAPAAMRSTTPSALARLMGRAAGDALGGLVGRAPVLLPTAGRPGEVALLTTPDALDAGRALDPDGQHPEWQQVVAARFALRVGTYRPGRVASRLQMPLLVVTGSSDTTAPPQAAIAAATRAPRGEWVSYDGAHYVAFLDAHESAVGAEIEFLQRHLAG